MYNNYCLFLSKDLACGFNKRMLYTTKPYAYLLKSLSLHRSISPPSKSDRSVGAKIPTIAQCTVKQKK